MKDISIRGANISDLVVLVGFQKTMALETENLLLSNELLTKGVSAALEDEEKAEYFVAEIDDKIVG